MNCYQPGPCMDPLIPLAESRCNKVRLQFKLTSCFHYKFQCVDFFCVSISASFFPSAPLGQKSMQRQLPHRCVNSTSPFLPHLLWAEHAHLQKNLSFTAISSSFWDLRHSNSWAKKKNVRANSIHPLQRHFIFSQSNMTYLAIYSQR